MDESRAPAALKRHIYVIDDDRVIRRSLSFALETAGFSVRPFMSGEDFLEELPSLAPGPVILDLRMPGLDGFAMLAMLQEVRSQFPVIVMTGHGDVVTAVRAMKAGARDFVEKPCSDAVLLDMLEAIFDELDTGPPTVERRVQAKTLLGALSPRELEVLGGLVAGLPNKMIAHKLSLSTRTVEMHRANMMGRLSLTSLSGLLRIAFSADIQPMA